MNDSNYTIYTWQSCRYWKPETHLERTLKVASISLVCIFGILANIFIIVLALKYTARRSLHHLIINMAVSDALFLGRRIFKWMSNDTITVYPDSSIGDTICKTSKAVYFVSYHVSLVTLLFISIERLKALRRTFQISRPITWKRRVIVLTSCWLIPLIFNSPVLYYYEISRNDCKTINKTVKTIHSITLILFDSIIVLLVFSLGIVTLRRLSKVHAAGRDVLDRDVISNSRKKRIRSAVLMVLVSLLLYICCWTPHRVYWFFRFLDKLEIGVQFVDYRSQCLDWASLNFVLGFVLTSASSAFSPTIYILFLADFRKATKKILCQTPTICCVNRSPSVNLPAIISTKEHREMRRTHVSRDEHHF